MYCSLHPGVTLPSVPDSAPVASTADGSSSDTVMEPLPLVPSFGIISSSSVDDLPPLRHSSHVSKPTACPAASLGTPYIFPVQQAVLNSLVSVDHHRDLHAHVEDVPDDDDSPDPLPSHVPSTFPFQQNLKNLLAADGVPADTSLDKPPTYQVAMASPYADQWHSALEEEFASHELGVYKLVPQSSIPVGQTIIERQACV